MVKLEPPDPNEVTTMTEVYDMDLDLEVSIKTEPGKTKTSPSPRPSPRKTRKKARPKSPELPFRINETRTTYMKFLSICKPPKGNKASVAWDPFYIKLYEFLKEKDFELPALNRQEFSSSWFTLRLPTKTNMKKMKIFFPQLETNSITEKQFNRLLKRCNKLMRRCGIDNRDELIDKLQNPEKIRYNRLRLLFTCYIAGAKLLNKRLILDVWFQFIEKLKNPTFHEPIITEEMIANSSEGEFMMLNFFQANDVPIGRKKLVDKILLYLTQHDFRLPELNRQKWSIWPGKKPKEGEFKKLEILFPLLERGVLTEKEENRIVKRFDKLIEGCEESRDNNIESRNAFLDQILKLDIRYSRLKVLIGAYIGGKKMLRERLALDVWNRLLRASEKWNGSKVSRANIVQVTDGIQKRDFNQVKSEMGFQKCQVRNVIVGLKYFLEKEKLKKPNGGPYSIDDETTLIYLVFKVLDIKNILDYDPSTMHVPWVKISEELKRPAQSTRTKWTKMYHRLLYYEETGEKTFYLHEWNLKAIQMAQDLKVTKAQDVPSASFSKAIRYINTAEVKRLFVTIAREAEYKEVPYEVMMQKFVERYQRFKKGQIKQDKFEAMVNFYELLKSKS